MKYNSLNKKGFTLIELLAVIAILGLLIVIAGLSVTSILKKSKTDVNDVQGNKLIDIAKLIVMDKPDIFSCKYLDIVGYPAPTGIECKLGTGNSCDCVINNDGFNGYADKKINGCVFVNGCTNDSCDKETTYKYESNEENCFSEEYKLNVAKTDAVSALDSLATCLSTETDPYSCKDTTTFGKYFDNDKIEIGFYGDDTSRITSFEYETKNGYCIFYHTTHSNPTGLEINELKEKIANWSSDESSATTSIEKRKCS